MGTKAQFRGTDPRTSFGTPREIYDPLNAEFGFNLDAAASAKNALCKRYFDEETNALEQDWGGPGTVAFLNPPYARGFLEPFMRKAWEESLKGVTVVCLIYHDSRTKWWRRWIEGKAEIRRVLGYVQFIDPDTGEPAPYKSQMPCAILVYRAARVVQAAPAKRVQIGKATLLHGDSLRLIHSLEEESAHAIVTDPPGGKGFMNLSWDADRGGRDMWVGWLAAIFRGAFPVLKPGGFAVVWSATARSHWTALALEDAGFKIVDTYAHMYGQGMPKSSGLLKPGREDWIIAQRPFKGSIKNNVRKHGVGQLFPAHARLSRAAGDEPGWWKTGTVGTKAVKGYHGSSSFRIRERTAEEVSAKYTGRGRHPANMALSHTPECICIEDQAWSCTLDCPVRVLNQQRMNVSRFYYCPKVLKAEHPTQKPLELMRHLILLISQPGQVILDPFAGSGTTPVAALLEERECIAFEQEAAYFKMMVRHCKEIHRG